MKKAQATVEYMLIIAVVLIIVALTAFFVFDIFGKQTSEAQFSACRNAASTCNKNKVLYGNSYDCFKVCFDSCVDPNTEKDLLIGKPTDCYDAYHNLFDGSACGFCNAGLLEQVKPAG